MLPSLFTAFALVAFAANSILCRLALGAGAIDAYAFTAIRLGSGALFLGLIWGRRRGSADKAEERSWHGAFFLLLYALPFSLAYVRLEAGAGALLLFGAVQVTMIVQGLASGERPRTLEWLGLVGAVAGIGYLVFPGLAAPDPIGAAFMVIAGFGWGCYSVIGKSAGAPGPATATAFRRAALVLVTLTCLGFGWLNLSVQGVILAAVSGTLASGLGYAVWYTALGHLSLTRAALVQLSVPVLAGAGGVALLGEAMTGRFIAASVVILGSIATGILARMYSGSEVGVLLDDFQELDDEDQG